MEQQDYYGSQYDSGSRSLAALQQQQLLRQIAKVRNYNQKPKNYKPTEAMEIANMAQQLGLDISEGVSRDKALLGEQIGAGIGGAADALLFGLIPDKWYSSYRTNTGKSIGKLAGSLLSFAIPGIGALGGAKTIGGVGARAYAGSKAAYGTLGGLNSVKSTKDALAMAQLLLQGGVSSGKAALAIKLAGNSAAKIKKLAEIAHALVRTTQTVSNAGIAMHPNMYGEPSPYSTMNIMGGMPPVQ